MAGAELAAMEAHVTTPVAQKICSSWGPELAGGPMVFWRGGYGRGIQGVGHRAPAWRGRAV
jgi:hypothetical protein